MTQSTPENDQGAAQSTPELLPTMEHRSAMRAFGYQVGQRADTEYGSLWEMRAPGVSDTTWLVKDEAEGWEKAFEHWQHKTIAAALSRIEHSTPDRNAVPSVRPEVAAFALLMEQQLRANDHKPGWKNDDPNALADRVLDEARELAEATAAHGLSRSYEWNFEGTATEERYRARLAEVTANIGAEAADVANMAMMVADVCAALTTTPEPTDPAGVSEMANTLAEKVTAWFHGRNGAESDLAYFVANNRSAIDAALRTPPVLEVAKEALTKLRTLLVHRGTVGGSCGECGATWMAEAEEHREGCLIAALKAIGAGQ